MRFIYLVDKQKNVQFRVSWIVVTLIPGKLQLIKKYDPLIVEIRNVLRELYFDDIILT